MEYPGSYIYKMETCDDEVLEEYAKRNLKMYVVPSLSYDKICTPKEFGQYIGSSNVTYDDIRNTLSSIDIEDKYKNIILEGINNLEANGFNMSLDVLNYNLNHLKIEHADSLDKETATVAAEFNPVNSTVTVTDNKVDGVEFEYIFLHEILGHGMTDAYVEDSKIYCTDSMPACLIEDNEYKGNEVLGDSFKEALAEIIASTASNTKVNDNSSMYTVPMYGLLLLLKTNKISVVDYADNGVYYLIDKMKKNNLGKDINYIKCLDDKLNRIAFLNMDNNDYTLEDMTVGYLMDYYDTNNSLTIENIKECIRCYPKYLVPTVRDGLTAFILNNTDCSDYICIENLEYCLDEYIKANSFQR